MIKGTLESGFTLIEILVASLILFSSISIVTVIYKGAIVATEKAGSHITISGIVPILLKNIRQEIGAKSDSNETLLSGEGKEWGVPYKWSATLNSFKKAQPLFDPDSGVFVEQKQKYKLWVVDLRISFSGVERGYLFKELSWNEK